MPAAQQYPVLVTAAGNPKKIASVADLLRDDVRVSLADPEAAAVGKAVRQALSQTKQWDEVWANKTTARVTVNEVANDVAAVGAADVGIVWNATAAQYENLETIEVPALTQQKQQIVIAVLQKSKQPTAALKFARYLTARDKGLSEFASRGYDVVEGDKWAARPELVVFGGSVNKPVAGPIIDAFARREGIDVATTWNGCGVLVGNMKSGLVPDVYFACDTCFIEEDEVAVLFGSPLDICSTDLVIVTAAGNPKQIQKPQDMLRDDVKAIINNKDKSALGRLTKTMLDAPEFGFWQQLYDKAVDQPVTGDVATQAVMFGLADAAIVYKTNAIDQAGKGKLEIIPIAHRLAGATQPIAVGTATDYPNLAQRLVDRLNDAEHTTTYEKAGFRFLGGSGDSE
jgi:molybdate transport system substrate-binding protein